MKHFAKVAGGVIVNISISENEWPLQDDPHIECPDGFGIGDFYDGFVFSKKPQPTPTPEQLAAQEKAAADAAAILAAKQDAFIATIAGFTMAQVDTFVDNNFASFTNPQKNFLKAVGKMAVLSARKL